MLPACFLSPFYEDKVSLPNLINYQQLLCMTMYVRANLYARYGKEPMYLNVQNLYPPLFR